MDASVGKCRKQHRERRDDGLMSFAACRSSFAEQRCRRVVGLVPTYWIAGYLGKIKVRIGSSIPHHNSDKWEILGRVPGQK